jgi:hypothetical protein
LTDPDIIPSLICVPFVMTGVPGLAIWATLLGGLLLAGAFLVYSTSALA